jgi:hypothetical protein
MGLVRFGLVILLLSGCFLGAADAQAPSDSGKQVADTPRDYGAGYKIVMVSQHQEHAVQKSDLLEDSDHPGPVQLQLYYPLIAAPLTPAAIAYNAEMKGLIARWWKDIGGPKDNSQTADPNTDYWISCTPGAGIGNGEGPPFERMLPGVISMSCSASAFPHDSNYSGGLFWGFNWLVAQRRPITPGDIFTPNSVWLKALTALVNTDRGGDLPSYAPKLDYADRHRWVIGADGLGLNYSANDFVGQSQGGAGSVDLIGWDKLEPYLRKGGIVPQSDWSAKGVSDLFPGKGN